MTPALAAAIDEAAARFAADAEQIVVVLLEDDVPPREILAVLDSLAAAFAPILMEQLQQFDELIAIRNLQHVAAVDLRAEAEGERRERHE